MCLKQTKRPRSPKSTRPRWSRSVCSALHQINLITVSNTWCLLTRGFSFFYQQEINNILSLLSANYLRIRLPVPTDIIPASVSTRIQMYSIVCSHTNPFLCFLERCNFVLSFFGDNFCCVSGIFLIYLDDFICP